MNPQVTKTPRRRQGREDPVERTAQAVREESPIAEPWLFQNACALVARELEEADAIFLQEVRSRQPFVDQLVTHSTRWRGKRLRPALLLLTAKACGELRREHKVLAAVVEMIHTATLVHDDVLDEAAVRRHLATINAQWGNEASVLLGDYLFTHAFHLASSLESTLACRMIGRATNIVCEGELRQVHHRGNFQLDESEYLEIIAGKTAELCACSCRLGAYWAGAPQPTQEALERYGHNLGMAFQIADDLLDCVGDEQEAGKSLGTDLEKQKLTLPLIRLLGQAAPEASARVRQILSSPGNHKRQALAPLFAASDAITYSQQRAMEYAQEACDELACLAASPAKAVLVSLTEWVASRRR